jgi:hypothetical protein
MPGTIDDSEVEEAPKKVRLELLALLVGGDEARLGRLALRLIESSIRKRAVQAEAAAASGRKQRTCYHLCHFRLQRGSDALLGNDLFAA